MLQLQRADVASEPAAGARVVRRRVDATTATTSPTARYAGFLRRAGKRTLHVLDILFGGERRQAVVFGTARNRAWLKRKLLQDYWGEQMAELPEHERSC